MVMWDHQLGLGEIWKLEVSSKVDRPIFYTNQMVGPQLWRSVIPPYWLSGRVMLSSSSQLDDLALDGPSSLLSSLHQYQRGYVLVSRDSASIFHLSTLLPCTLQPSCLPAAPTTSLMDPAFASTHGCQQQCYNYTLHIRDLRAFLALLQYFTLNELSINRVGKHPQENEKDDQRWQYMVKI